MDPYCIISYKFDDIMAFVYSLSNSIRNKELMHYCCFSFVAVSIRTSVLLEQLELLLLDRFLILPYYSINIL